MIKYIVNLIISETSKFKTSVLIVSRYLCNILEDIN